MFKQEVKTTTVEIILDGQNTHVPANVSVAAALLAIGTITARISPTAKEPRAPHCLMGICFECLMEIDGVQRQACMTEVEENMVINRRVEVVEGEK
ncbi:MAG: succinate dehydrogenase/fumarate reductase-like Fe-S protein [Desulforhopalus sp.]|jgi:succinate dehydrogenase/fumarate reductase-like Fe-S protein